MVSKQTRLDDGSEAGKPSEKEGGEKDFLEKAREVGEFCLGMESPVIVSHHDADGLSAHGIAANAFRKSGKEFKSVVLKRLDEDALSALSGIGKEFVFLDFGSGLLEAVRERLGGKCAVIAHHPAGEAVEGIAHLNPHLFGFDGAFECSSSAAAYFCFRHLREPVLAELGIVGAVGDMQDENGLIGLNKVMLDDAVQGGSVFRTRDLRLFGRISRPLVWFLSYCSEPFLPGLTGNEKNCAFFLERNGIPFRGGEGEWLSYYDLSVFDRKRFVSALVNYCLEKGVSEEAAKEMIGDVFIFLNEPERSELRDACEFSTLLNACGRHEKGDLGVSVCLHDESAFQNARKVLLEHRAAIRKGIWFAKKHFMDLGAFYFIDGRKAVSDTVIGTVAGSFFNSGLVKRDKPVIAFSLDEEQNIKASSRGSRALVEKGLDLGGAMKKAGEAVRGAGGGHSVAAGATFAPTKENEALFLKKCKEIISVQLEMS